MAYHRIEIIQEKKLERDIRFNAGDRYRLAGEYNLKDLPGFYNGWDGNAPQRMLRAHEANNNDLDTWATITKDAEVGGNIYVKLEDVYGHTFKTHLSQTAFKMLAIEGQERESTRLLLESALARHVVDKGLTPIYEPTMLRQMSSNGESLIGSKLIIDGIDYGTIADHVKDGENIFVETQNGFLCATSDCRNEVEKLQNKCYDMSDDLLKAKSAEGISKELVVDFMIDNYKELPLLYSSEDVGFKGSRFFEELKNDSEFMSRIGMRMADYMQRYGVTDIVHTNNKEIINDLVGMIKCEMYDSGYIKMDNAPSIEARNYLQSLGYDQESMQEKQDILSRWIKDKDLTRDEMLVAQSIAEQKIVYQISDVYFGKMRYNYDTINIFGKQVQKQEKAESTQAVFSQGGTMKATLTNLATGEVEVGQIQIPKAIDVYGRGFGDVACTNDNAIYVTWDVSELYQQFGGFDYSKALEQAQALNPETPTVAEINDREQ